MSDRKAVRASSAMTPETRKGRKPELRVRWSQAERDVMYYWEAGSKRDSHVVVDAMDRMLKELEKRGYDLRSVRFQIRRAEDPCRVKS